MSTLIKISTLQFGSLQLIKRFSVLILLCCPILSFASNSIAIFYSAATSTNLEFVESFKAEISSSSRVKLRILDLSELDKPVTVESGELVIALGVKALEVASKLKRSVPVIGVFTPLPVFNHLLETSHRDLGNFSAIVLDQPYARQLKLIKTVMPEAKKIGVLLGPLSLKYADVLKEEADEENLVLDLEFIGQESDLIAQLNKTLESSDVLLAIPDALIYNRETAQPLLLTSYRHQKPIFGYSAAYVRAGAIAAVFSTTKQLAKQVAEITTKDQTVAVLPPPQVPKYFSVVVNYQVARSLGISVADEESILKRIRLSEANEHEPAKN